jgi:hypothetical protein
MSMSVRDLRVIKKMPKEKSNITTKVVWDREHLLIAGY